MIRSAAVKQNEAVKVEDAGQYEDAMLKVLNKYTNWQ
jgi:hypothetical protein